MKRLIAAAVSLSLLGGTAAMAQPHDHGHDQRAYDQGAQRGNDQGGQDQRGHDQRGEDQRRNDQRGYDQRANHQRGEDRRDRNEAAFDRRDNGHDRGHHYGQTRQWARGERLPNRYYGDPGYYVDYRAHHLRHPPRGYRWVRVDNDYMLASTASGLIAQIIVGR